MLSVLLFACGSDPGADNRIRLKDLSKYHGKEVEIEGFFSYEFEDVSICAGRKPEACYWIDFDNTTLDLTVDSLTSISGKEVIIKGTGDTASHGHLGAYKGTIKKITYIGVR